MNLALQIVRRSDGVRSPPAESERAVFADVLRSMLTSDDNLLSGDDYVLVLHEQVDNSEEWRVSAAPLLTVDQFVEAFAP